MFARYMKITAALACGIVFCNVSRAGFTAEVTGVSPDQNVYFKAGDLAANGIPNVPNGSVAAGQINWLWKAGPDKPNFVGSNNTFSGFCVELNQNVRIGASDTFTQTSLNSVPQPGNGQGSGTNTGMGTIRASIIQELVDKFYSANMSNTDAAALQVAIWKVVYEAAGSGALELADYKIDPNDTGRFHVAYGTSSSVISSADNMLNAIKDNDGTYQSHIYQVSAFTSPTYQDQIVITHMPAPATAVLFALGLPIVALRRRMKAKD